MEAKNKWILNEIKGIELSDKRLVDRLQKLLGSLSKGSDNSIPSSCKSWKETIAAYRFFSNKNVNYKEILSVHQQASLDRIRKEKIILIPQDTTDIDFSSRKAISGMGHLMTNKSQGLYLHASIAVTPQKLNLGVVDTQIWSREKLGIRKDRKSKQLEEKESYRWLKGFNVANEIANSCPDTLVVSISDREGDIYEVLEKSPSETTKAFWLIRSSINRRLERATDSEIAKLHDCVKATNPIGRISFELPQGTIYTRKITTIRSPRKNRTVIQQIRICKATLSPPKRKNKKLSPTTVNIIHCEEINPPSIQEKLEWFLITSLPVNDLKLAKKIISWYLCRWQIEVFFKVLKSGCTIEKLQLKSIHSVINSIALYLIIAWRILYLTMLSRVYPMMKCDRVFESVEWQSLYAMSKKLLPP